MTTEKPPQMGGAVNCVLSHCEHREANRVKYLKGMSDNLFASKKAKLCWPEIGSSLSRRSLNEGGCFTLAITTRLFNENLYIERSSSEKASFEKSSSEGSSSEGSYLGRSFSEDSCSFI